MKKIQPMAASSPASHSTERRLAAYLAAVGTAGVALAPSDAQAEVVGNNTVQPFGVIGVVSIDFNQDGQTDFQVDHDQVTLPGGPTLDYLQIDKNDINGEGNPLAFDPVTGFQAATFTDGASTRNDANNAGYVITGPQGSYPAALNAGTLIGSGSTFDWQESDNFQGSGKDIRANRLIDEDATQIDQVLGGQPPSGVQVPLGSPGFIGLGGQVRYLGLKMELNNSGEFNYGWVGVRIDSEAEATGAVVGYGYQSTPGAPLLAGAVPEPGTLVTAAVGALSILGAAVVRSVRGRTNR